VRFLRDKGIENRIEKTFQKNNNVWVVGDIHGYYDTFVKLVSRLNLNDGDLVISIGDMIDGGSESVGVVELFIENDQFLSILGNHEQMLLDDWNKKSKFEVSSLKSSGFWASKNPVDRNKKLTIVEYLSYLPSEIVLEKFRLVHAGYRDFPYSSSLDEQTDEDRLWSRDIFTVRYPFDQNRTIIVGHTTIQKFGLINDDSIWRSEIKLEDGRDSAIGIDSGIKLHNDQNPRITAVELNSGKIISQRKVEIND
jgi:serine/threonine protein phosphatase 1|tara:strand:+ start:463 stop:1218 length:756 start_codon:yes stop_codon:yes gene_type:complete